MAEGKKYYWIKLKTDFFSIDKIDWLLSQKNGAKYIVLYQMLCLMTANNGGELALRVNEMIVPYDIDKIARDTKYFDADTVRVALELFKKLGLIMEQENEMFRIANYDELIGGETSWAIKKRRQRGLPNIEEPPGIADKDMEKAIEIAKTPWIPPKK